MEKEKTKNPFKNFFNPFYKGVCKMKPLRIFLVVALVVVPLLASDAWADFTPGWYDVQGGKDSIKISANSTNQPILGFVIPKNGNDTLKYLTVKSYMERAFSVQALKLWVETNGTPG